MGASRCLPKVVVKHAAEFFLAADAAYFGKGRGRFDEFVPDPLMVASIAIMAEKDRNGYSQMSFAQAN